MKVKLRHLFLGLCWFAFKTSLFPHPILVNQDKINLVANSAITLVDRSFSFQVPVDSIIWQKPNSKEALFFNSEHDAYLLKVELFNPGSTRTCVISCENPNTDHFEVFEKHKNGFNSIHKSGDIYHWSKRDLKEAYPSYRVAIKQDECKIYYVKVYMDEEGLIPVSLYSLSAYYKGFAQRELFFGLFAGIMLLMAFFNLFLFILTKNKLQLYYVFYIVFIALTHSALFGNGLGHFYSFSVFLAKYDAILFSSILGPVAIILILKYFDFGKKKMMHNLFRWHSVLYILILILVLFTHKIDIGFNLLNIVFLISYILAYWIMLYSFKFNKFLALSFIVAWSFLLFGGFVFAGINFGIIKYSQFKLYLTPLGAIIETFLLSFVLGYNINQLKNTKARSELNLLLKDEENRMLAIEKKEMELHALKSQMNPHFIFNALSSIQFYILKNKTNSALTYIGNFGKLIRKSFSFAEKKSIPLSEEIKFLKQYLNLEKNRLPNTFDYSINIDNNLDTENIKIPPFIIQPMVENATKHAFVNIDYPGILDINIRQNKNNLIIVVMDNGIGFNANTKRDHHESKGIAITKKRLHLIQASNKTNRKATVQIKDKKTEMLGQGVQVTIVIPLNLLKGK